PQPGDPAYELRADKATFKFANYGYLRVARDGSVIARGGWKGFRLPGAKGPVTLNGKAVPTKQEGGLLVYDVPTLEAKVRGARAPECPLSVTIAPAVVGAFKRDRRTVTITVKTTLGEAVRGHRDFPLPAGVVVEPKRPQFEQLKPGASIQLPVTFVT